MKLDEIIRELGDALLMEEETAATTVRLREALDVAREKYTQAQNRVCDLRRQALAAVEDMAVKR